MNEKIAISVIIRRSIVVICAVFCFLTFFACSDDPSSLPTLSGVFAPDVSVEYDGRPHSITVSNALPTDSIIYSTDNISFSSSCPSFTDVGTYTVYFKVLRSGYAEFSSSASVSISPTILSDISAVNLSFIYNGLSHSPVIDGTLPSDAVTYSTDGVSFSSDVPSFIDVGVYTVYYRVDRAYGEYRSSCVITVLPNIYGRYFNSDHGVIVISEDLSFSISGSGYIDGIPFSVTDGVLTYNSIAYSILSEDDCVYRLTVSDNSVYIVSSASGSLSISFNDNVALITLNDDLLLSVPNFNYCESGIISDYNDLCFTQAFSSSSLGITDISVVLSVREVNPVTVDTLYFTYDGLPHGFDFDDDVKYLSDEHSFTDVGSYTVSVVFTSSLYLPKRLECTIVILPFIDGVFISSDHVIQISSESFYLDGKLCGKLSVVENNWAWDDLPITVTDGGIEYDGASFASVSSPVLAVYIDDLYCSCLLVSSDILHIHISYDGYALNFTDEDNNLLLGIPLSCDSFSATIDGYPLSRLENSASFTLGYSDISSPVAVVSVSLLNQ